MKKHFLFLALAFSAVIRSQELSNTLSAADKVYGLSKFWQEVNYNFIYMDKVDKTSWDSAYREMIVSIQKTANDYEYYRELQRFCALLKDGHTNVYFPQAINNNILTKMFGKYQLFISNYENKAIITRTNLSIKGELPIGSEITEVNGLKTWDYINKYVSPYISSSTDYVLKDRAVELLLKGFQGEHYNITVKRPDGKVENINLTHEKTPQEALFPPLPKWELFNFRWYPGDIAYVALNAFDDRKIDSLFIQKLPELYKAKALILDLRENGGGSTDIGFEILEYLTNDPVLYGSKSLSRKHVPTYMAWGKSRTAEDTLHNEWAKKVFLASQGKLYEPLNEEPDSVKLTAKRIVVPTAILIGHGTASAAEDFLIYADNQKHMIRIGQNSFGSTGQPYSFDLPGGGGARICTKKDTYFDGREFVGKGVKPDIEVALTLKDFLQKKDATLDKALDYLHTKTR